MNKKVLSLLQYMFFLGLGIFLVWWSLGKIENNDWEEIKAAFRRANYWLTLPVCLVLLLAHFSRAIRWKILMEPLGYKPRLTNTFLAVLIGYLANLAVPRLGEVLKCTILSRYEKVPADKLIGTIVAERAFDMICLVLVFAITIFSQIDVIGDFSLQLLRELFSSKQGGMSKTKLAILLSILVIILLLTWYILRRFRHINFIGRIRKIIKGIWQGLTSVRFVQKKGWFFFHTFFIWFMYLLSVRIGMYAMEETAHYGMKTSLSVLSLGSIGMIVTQGGIGAYPLLVQETMTLYGLSDNLGKAFGWLLWLTQFVQILVCGFIALALLPYLNKQKKLDEKTGSALTENPNAA
ncbi:MAG TPA: lysylphosphatidylglycerol synthase transmembrane domain-containing protein [Flavitalea sp.]|nr:lysylphosphatidylglycerol synthase transmembrane domain-containing protein [Flavitalea sp.]